MVELVDTYALGAYAFKRAGSNPVPGTRILTKIRHLGGFNMWYNRIMEKRIRDYEKFIKKKADKKLNGAEQARLARYHYEMLENFQHERLVHLIVTLFFSAMAVAFLFIASWATVAYNLRYEMLPLYGLTIILVILTGFYVKHYYFLENHIQDLYKYTTKLHDISK